MKTASINNILELLVIISLYGCSSFENKLSSYMEDISPITNDTTYWREVDLQDVIGIKYDKLFIIASDFQEDIAKGTGSDWSDGDYIDWDKKLLLLVKDGKVVYKDEIENCDRSFYMFDQNSSYCSNPNSDSLLTYHTNGWPLIDKSTVYYIRVDVIRRKRYYTLYNKERMENGNIWFIDAFWLRDRDATATPPGIICPSQCEIKMDRQ